MIRRKLLVLSIVSGALLHAPASDAEVLIGLATPLTGHMAWAGASNQVGAESAVADLNPKGGVLGERIEMLVVDDACDPDQAVAAAQRLVDAGVVLAIGHHCSIASLPASGVYAEAGALMISPFSTNPKLTEQGFPTVFRICGRDDVQGGVAGDLLADRFGEKSIAIVHENAVYGQGLAAETKKRLNERGVAEVMLEAIEPGRAEYFDVVRGMQAADVEVLYYAGFRREAGLIVREAHDSGYDLQLFAADGIGGEDFALIAGPAADGTLMTYAPSPLAHPEAALLAERFAAEGYAGSFGLGTFRSYAVVQAWAQAVEQAGTLCARRGRPGASHVAIRHGARPHRVRSERRRDRLQRLCLVRLARRQVRAGGSKTVNRERVRKTGARASDFSPLPPVERRGRIFPTCWRAESWSAGTC
jgi:branched-chain amino acid transport system substrate-binding protein